MKRSWQFLVLSTVLPVVLIGLILGIASRVGSVLAYVQTPQQASIALTMTVGTDPHVCATEQTLTLPLGGGDVTYCYAVNNTGDVTLTRHTLQDERLGAILLDFPFSLVPGATVFVTQTESLTVSTTNSATWTAYNPGPVDLVSDGDGVTVTVTVPQPALILSKTVGLDPGLCATSSTLHLPVGGGDVTYCYEVTNTGNVTLTRHTLQDDRLGAILLDFPFSLTPGASAFLTQTALITMTTVNSATWTAYNPGPVQIASDTDETVVIVGLRIYLPFIYKE